MISRKSGVRDVLNAEAVIRIFLVLRGLNVNPALACPNTPGFGVLNHGGTATFGLNICLISRCTLINRHISVILLLFSFIFLVKFLFFFVR